MQHPNHHTPARLTLIAALIIALSGCATLTDTHAPTLDTLVQTPHTFSKQAAVDAPPLDGWCSDFGEPELDRLVDQAFADNLDLKGAHARVAQSEALVALSSAGAFPTLDLSTTGGRAKGAGGPTGTTTNNQFSASLSTSYEIDLWGRLEANAAAADYDRQAARADAESMAISLSSQVAGAWLDLVHQRQSHTLLHDQIETAERYLELLHLRQKQGLSTALDIRQQEQQLEALAARLTRIEANEETAHQRLAVLLARPPTQPLVSEDAQQLPALPPTPGTGLPADLLTRRPDVRAAGLRLSAADKRIESAVADQLPKLRLSANLSVQSAEIEKLFEEILWSAAASATQSLIDGGRRSAEVERTEAAARERAYAYAQSLLTAMQDVEAAMTHERQQVAFLDHLQIQRDKASEALTLSRERYQQGSVDYLRVLSSLQSLQQLDQDLLDAKRNQIDVRLQLCRALGGDWTQDLTASE